MNSRSHNSAYSRLMVLSDLGTDNVVKASGGSRDLANGQIGLFRMAGATARGVQAVASMDSYSGKELFQIQVGTGRTQEAGNMTNKNFSTISFTRDDVLDVTFDTAKAPVYSEVTLGYNGTAGTGIKLKENEATTVSLQLFGEQLSYLGFRDGIANMQFSVFSGSPEACDNCLNPCANTSCTSIVRDLVEDIRTYELRAGSDLGTGASIKVGDLVEVIGTYSCTPDLKAASSVKYWTLELCDDGTAQALAKVQSQYDDGTVVSRIEREGTQSTYQIIKGVAPANFAPTQTYTLEPSGAKRLIYTPVLLDCEVCPTGYSKVTGGYVWKITLQTDMLSAANIKTALEATAATTASVTAVGRGTGDVATEVFIGVIDAEVTHDSVLAQLIAVAPGVGLQGVTSAADVEIVAEGQSSDVCVSDTDGVASTIPWDEGKSCDIFSKTIELDVDLDCGPFATAAARTAAANAKLAELQGIYPDLSVALSTADIGECRARFTGTLISSPVCDDCETPDPIFQPMPDDYEFSAWSERTVGASEITSFTLTNGFTAIGAKEDVNVNESSPAVTTKPAGSTFSLVVATDPAAVDTVVVKIDTSAPSTGFAVGDTIVIDADQALSGFDAGTNGTITLTITGIGGQFPDDCECGIKFVAKNAFLCPPAMLADQIGTFTPKGVKIQVSGGEAPANLMEGYQFVTTPFKVTRHERDFDGTGWGINYMKQEKASAEYFAGISPRRSYAEGYLSGFETKLDPCTQYDKFTVKLRRNPYAGTASRRMGEEIRYVFLIPSNTGCSYESFVGALGGSVDCPKPADN